MKRYKTFRQFLEERGFDEIATTQSNAIFSIGKNPQALTQFKTAVQNMQQAPLEGVTGKNPKAQKELMAKLAQAGMPPSQQAAAMAPDQAKVNEPTPAMVQYRTMRKG